MADRRVADLARVWVNYRVAMRPGSMQAADRPAIAQRDLPGGSPRQEGRIHVDGELIYESGEFKI